MLPNLYLFSSIAIVYLAKCIRKNYDVEFLQYINASPIKRKLTGIPVTKKPGDPNILANIAVPIRIGTALFKLHSRRQKNTKGKASVAHPKVIGIANSHIRGSNNRSKIEYLLLP